LFESLLCAKSGHSDLNLELISWLIPNSQYIREKVLGDKILPPKCYRYEPILPDPKWWKECSNTINSLIPWPYVFLGHTWNDLKILVSGVQFPPWPPNKTNYRRIHANDKEKWYVC